MISVIFLVAIYASKRGGRKKVSKTLGEKGDSVQEESRQRESFTCK